MSLCCVLIIRKDNVVWFRAHHLAVLSFRTYNQVQAFRQMARIRCYLDAPGRVDFWREESVGMEGPVGEQTWCNRCTSNGALNKHLNGSIYIYLYNFKLGSSKSL